MARPTDPFSPRQQHLARRGRGQGLTTLPLGGYAGPCPSWPGDEAPTDQEQGLWDELWRTPQAARWIDSGYDRVVARYVRLYFTADAEPKGTFLSELRQIEDRLGLSPLGLRRLGWQIGGPIPSESAPERKKSAAEERYSTLRAVDR